MSAVARILAGAVLAFAAGMVPAADRTLQGDPKAGEIAARREQFARQEQAVRSLPRHDPIIEAEIVETDENCFPALLEAVEVCSLGQISERLQEVVGRFRPMV